MSGNPIELLRAACEQIKRSTGDRRPRHIAMHQAVYERYREWYIENIARAERLLGIGCAARGAFPTGWPWTKRAGRMSREEKQLREYLPGWRRALAAMPPSMAGNSGVAITLASALGEPREGMVSAMMMDEIVIGDCGGKTVIINEIRDYELSKEVSNASLMDAASEKGYGLAMIDRGPLSFVALTNSDVPTGWTNTANRRSTGKRAQRARSKPWGRR